MKFLNFLTLLFFISQSQVALYAQARQYILNDGTPVVFIQEKLAEEEMFDEANDPYYSLLGELELSIRLGSLAKDARQQNAFESRELFKTHAKNQILKWENDERKIVLNSLNLVHAMCRSYKRILPKKWLLIKTSGEEEAGMFYTRNTSLIIPQNTLNSLKDQRLELARQLLFGALVHYFKKNVGDRDALLSAIGFKSRGTIELGEWLSRVKITDPDCQEVVYSANINYHNKPTEFTLLMISRFESTRSDMEGLTSYIAPAFVRVEEKDKKWHVVIDESGRPYFLELRFMKNFFKKFGGKLEKYLHPCDILIKNLVRVIMRDNGFEKDDLEGHLVLVPLEKWLKGLAVAPDSK